MHATNKSEQQRESKRGSGSQRAIAREQAPDSKSKTARAREQETEHEAECARQGGEEHIEKEDGQIEQKARRQSNFCGSVVDT